MAKLRVSAVIPGRIEEVYQKATAHSPSGPPDEFALVEKYGRMVQRAEGFFIFEETTEDQLQWRVSFDPPHQRSMEAVNDTWADRLDVFEQTSSDRTRWTITWSTKAHGVTNLLQLLLFQIFGKRRAMRRVVSPVLDEFRGQNPAPQ